MTLDEILEKLITDPRLEGAPLAVVQEMVQKAFEAGQKNVIDLADAIRRGSK